ncbi:CAP domain-containing protein [Bacillus sp. FJAT-45350]|uniref:CAP domain-containing protein n=1 Tax=Bacillus sp. FJAT-45350 TaxID=2011014 RepID=UPI00359C39B3
MYVVEDGEINVDEGDIPAQLQQFSPDQIKNALRHQLDGISQDELQRFSPDRLEQMVRDQLGEAAPTPGEQPEQATPEAPQPDTERETPQATPDREAPEAREPVADTPAPTPAPEQARPEAPTPAPTQPEAEPEAEQRQEQAPEARAEGLSDFEAQVVELTNAERRKNGLSDLQADTQLSSVARKKSTDMQQNNYFSHTSPTYGSPFDMMRDQGVSYTAAAENIAQGQRTPQEVVQAWMNSEGHRKNIMNGNFTHIGVGYEQNGHHWTQMFITK